MRPHLPAHGQQCRVPGEQRTAMRRLRAPGPPRSWNAAACLLLSHLFVCQAVVASPPQVRSPRLTGGGDTHAVKLSGNDAAVDRLHARPGVVAAGTQEEEGQRRSALGWPPFNHRPCHFGGNLVAVSPGTRPTMLLIARMIGCLAAQMQPSRLEQTSCAARVRSLPLPASRTCRRHR